MTRTKRVVDVIAASVGLVILLPLLVSIALLIGLGDGGPVLFRQVRIGRGGRPFQMLKFRTMRPAVGSTGSLLTVGADPRITPVGRLLRKWKLDELPQLWNVVMGEMSLVGPRPEVPGFVSHYTVQQRRVLDLTPGITDPASIRFKNENELLARASCPERVYVTEIMPEKIRLNLEYATASTIWSDVGQILQTVRLIVADVGLPHAPPTIREQTVRRSSESSHP